MIFDPVDAFGIVASGLKTFQESTQNQAQDWKNDKQGIGNGFTIKY